MLNVYRYANEWENGEDGSVKLMDSFGIVKVPEISELVKNIDNLPGTITLADEANVLALLEAYQNIAEVYRPAVTNYDKLLAAKKAIDKLNGVDEILPENVQEVIDRINNLPAFITLEWTSYIRITRQKYNALTQDEKLLIYNYSLLTDAEKEIKRLELLGEADYAKAQEVIDFINKLPSVVTWQMKDDLITARAMYDALSKDQKALVTNYSKLAELEYEFWLKFKDNAGNIVDPDDKDPDKKDPDKKDPDGNGKPSTGDADAGTYIILISAAAVLGGLVIYNKKRYLNYKKL